VQPYRPVVGNERKKTALQPKFQSDLFISCRHAANQWPDCWLDEFERALRLKVIELMVGNPKIWRDTESKPLGEIWKQAIARNIDDAVVDLRVSSYCPTPAGSHTSCACATPRASDPLKSRSALRCP
jgi:hypothetical protein